MQKIRIVKFNAAVAVGRGGEVHTHLHENSRIDMKNIKLEFDSDDRFLRVVLDETGTKYDLIPMSNIASLGVDEE